jgi:tRNA dimethylallyltransferase
MSVNEQSLVCVTGPTASGKTDWAIHLAKDLGRDLANADGFQFYREIPILSNQPREPLESWHYLAHRSISDPTNAGEFSKEAASDLHQAWVWVGTGLYLGALLYGLDESPQKGTPFQGSPRRDFQMFVLNPHREELYHRINTRVDHMWSEGALDEAKWVEKAIGEGRISPDAPPLKAIGLRQLLMLLRGELSEEKAIDLWKQETRRLAKRQWTWLRKFCPPRENIQWLDPHLPL